MPFASNSDNSGRVSAGGFVQLPKYLTPPAAPTVTTTVGTVPVNADPGKVENPFNVPVGHPFADPTGAIHGGLGSSPPPPPPQAPNAPYTTDPGYQAALGQEQMGLGQLDAQLKALRERAIIDFGDPSLAAMAGFGLDPQAGAFAKQNYLSGNAQLARLDKNHDLMRQAVINRLASHGILDSGDLGYGSGQADQQYGNDLYDARGKLLDYLNGAAATDLQNRQSLHGGVTNAIQNAWTNFLAHPEMYPSTGNAPPSPPPPVVPAKKTTAAVKKVLVNPYTTGQKRFG